MISWSPAGDRFPRSKTVRSATAANMKNLYVVLVFVIELKTTSPTESIERFSTVCHETKIEVITLANHDNPMNEWNRETRAKTWTRIDDQFWF